MTTTPTSRRPSRKRDAMLAAADGLFLAEGYAAVSMEAVARAAGISKATLYAHLPGKDALFTAVIQARCAEMVEAAATLAGHEGTLHEGLARFGETTLRFLVAPRALSVHRIVLAEAARAPGLAAGFYAAGPLEARRALMVWLAEEQRLGRLDPGLDLEQPAIDFGALLRSDVWLRASLGLTTPDDTAIRAAAEHAATVFCRVYGVG